MSEKRTKALLDLQEQFNLTRFVVIGLTDEDGEDQEALHMISSEALAPEEIVWLLMEATQYAFSDVVSTPVLH